MAKAFAVVVAALALATPAGAATPRFLISGLRLPGYTALIQVVDGKGHVVRTLVQGAHLVAPAALVSPDGTHAAWVDETGLVVANADGTSARTLVPPPSCTTTCIGLTFAWSPDGTSLLVGGAGTETEGLEAVSVANGTVRVLDAPKPYDVFSVVGWSGSTIAYVEETGDAGTASCCHLLLTVARPDGSHPRILFSAREAIHDFPFAALAPDARHIAFTTDGRDTADPRVAVVDVRNGKKTVVQGVDPYTEEPVWSADSSELALQQLSGTTAVVSAAGKVVGAFGLKRARILDWSAAGIWLTADPGAHTLYFAAAPATAVRRVFTLPPTAAMTHLAVLP